MKKSVVIVVLSFVCVFAMSADDGLWTVSGTVSFKEEGTVYLSILTQEGFEDDYRYLKGVIIPIGPEELKSGNVEFEFTDIPDGTYALSAYLDQNGNGKMDMGFLGPKEPWGNYRYARPRTRGPKWEEVAFAVDKNLENIDIAIE